MRGLWAIIFPKEAFAFFALTFFFFFFFGWWDAIFFAKTETMVLLVLMFG